MTKERAKSRRRDEEGGRWGGGADRSPSFAPTIISASIHPQPMSRSLAVLKATHLLLAVQFLEHVATDERPVTGRHKLLLPNERSLPGDWSWCGCRLAHASSIVVSDDKLASTVLNLPPQIST